jgi:hypothetical protein
MYLRISSHFKIVPLLFCSTREVPSCASAILKSSVIPLFIMLRLMLDFPALMTAMISLFTLVLLVMFSFKM